MFNFGEVVTDGSLWLSVPLAALAGLVSFASPCVLPLVPGYLGYVSGLSGLDEKHRTRRTFIGIVLFILGFSSIFVLMSVVLAQIGAAPWLRGQTWVQVVLGLLVILMGLVFMGKVSWFQRDRKIERKGWAPCIGPTFAAVQSLVYLDGSNSSKAILLTLMYCLGLGIPFLLVALGITRGVSTFNWAKRHHRLLQQIGGFVLIIIGLMMATGAWNALISWVQSTLPTYTLPI